MLAQLAPVELHRLHCSAYVIGAVPDQVPVVAVRVCPTCAVPDTVGRAVFAGAIGASARPGRSWIATSVARPRPSKRLLPPPESVASHVPLAGRKTAGSAVRLLS